MPTSAHAARLMEWLHTQEAALIGRILDHALRNGFTAYTSTLGEAWRMSIAGLTRSLSISLEHTPEVPELRPLEDYSLDPAAAFGVREAKLHRPRGVPLSMFIALFQYYRQSYLEVLAETRWPEPEGAWAALYLTRFFDRVELGFLTEWNVCGQDSQLQDLQALNRKVTNEKNRFLTIFESLGVPVILLDASGRVDLMNFAASQLLRGEGLPGGFYYDPERHKEPLGVFDREIAQFCNACEAQSSFEAELLVDGQKRRVFVVRFRRMLDVSLKFVGISMILTDVTELKRSQQRLAELALELQVANVKLEELARLDPLTGVFNRRVLMSRMTAEVDRCQRHATPLSLAILDLDHFKEINDTHGHLVGDQVLVAVSKVLLAGVRSTDCVARFGGEEFCILLSHSDSEGGQICTERLRHQIEKLAFQGKDDGRFGITCSIGLSVLSESIPDLSTLLGRADAALYQAKVRGRNQVCLD